MASKLVELYQLGDWVEILFAYEEISEWRRARVMRHHHPGLWVQTEDDRKLWFVTNGKRIRPVTPAPHQAAS